METNPWQVECVEAFSHFICPECSFITQEITFFKDHAEEKHPLSSVLFGTKVTEVIEDTADFSDSETFQLKAYFKARVADSSDSPTSVNASKMITFTNISELSYLKKSTEDTAWDKYISEVKEDVLSESETEESSDCDPNESELEVGEETNELPPPCKTDYPNQNESDKVGKIEEYEDKYRESESEMETNSDCAQNIENESTLEIGEKANEMPPCTSHQNYSDKVGKIEEKKDNYSESESEANSDSASNVGNESEVEAKNPEISPCKTDFCNQNDLDKDGKHISSAHKGNPQKCPICFEEFLIKADLNKHFMSLHLSRKPYKCEICELCFSAIAQKEIHMESVHDVQKSTKCIDCGKIFPSTRNLKRHILSVHEGKKPYLCEICKSTFFSKSSLKKHIESVHEGNKCEICKSGFSSKSSLKKHFESVHDGRKLRTERSHICDVCGVSYVAERDLIWHIANIHGGNKPYLCEICGSR